MGDDWHYHRLRLVLIYWRIRFLAFGREDWIRRMMTLNFPCFYLMLSLVVDLIIALYLMLEDADDQFSHRSYRVIFLCASCHRAIQLLAPRFICFIYLPMLRLSPPHHGIALSISLLFITLFGIASSIFAFIYIYIISATVILVTRPPPLHFSLKVLPSCLMTVRYASLLVYCQRHHIYRVATFDEKF